MCVLHCACASVTMYMCECVCVQVKITRNRARSGGPTGMHNLAALCAKHARVQYTCTTDCVRVSKGHVLSIAFKSL